MGLLRLCVFGMPNVSHISTLDGLQLQELPKAKDIESIFCRFDGPNPDLRPPWEQVVTVVLIAPAGSRWKWFTGNRRDRKQICQSPMVAGDASFRTTCQRTTDDVFSADADRLAARRRQPQKRPCMFIDFQYPENSAVSEDGWRMPRKRLLSSACIFYASELLGEQISKICWRELRRSIRNRSRNGSRSLFRQMTNGRRQ